LSVPSDILWDNTAPNPTGLASVANITGECRIIMYQNLRRTDFLFYVLK
ncbi:hypothetical protein JTE90_000806, partial [Oedothorax gibbosus]